MHAQIASRMAATPAFTLALGALALAGAMVCTQAHAQLPPVQHQGAVDYVSGGIGTDESNAFKAAMSQFPLALTFASQANGRAAYAADVQVVIRNAQNNSDVLNIESQGPYCLVKLPPGHYQIFATYVNKTQSRKIAIGAGKTQRVMFEWK